MQYCIMHVPAQGPSLESCANSNEKPGTAPRANAMTSDKLAWQVHLSPLTITTMSDLPLPYGWIQEVSRPHLRIFNRSPQMSP